MKNLITLAVAALLVTVAFQSRASMTHDNVSHTSLVTPADASFLVNGHNIEWSSPALIPAPVPEPSALALLVASAFAFCLWKDRAKPN